MSCTIEMFSVKRDESRKLHIPYFSTQHGGSSSDAAECEVIHVIFRNVLFKENTFCLACVLLAGPL